MVLVDMAKRLDEPKVHEIRTMGKPNDAEAKRILTAVAEQVQPIMRKRGWVVPLLTEFYPNNHNLLGLNVGGGNGRTREVKVRLRKPRDVNSFYGFENALGTMLHELVHNVRGPHDNVFYKLLDEITSECEVLMAKGIKGTGQGFDAPSVGRLGSFSFIPTHNPDPSKLRDHITKAAEERAKRQRLMSSGPCRLGGDTSLARGLTPAEAAARAANRRLRDNLWCPCERIQAAVAAAGVSKAGTSTNASSAAGPSGARPGPGAQQYGQGSSAQPGQEDEEDRVIHIIEDDEHDAGGAEEAGGLAGLGMAGTAQQQAGNRHQQQQQQHNQQRQHRQHQQQQQEGTSNGDLIDLTLDDDTELPSHPSDPRPLGQHPQWSCTACTFLNCSSAAICEICASAPPGGGGNSAVPAPSASAAQPVVEPFPPAAPAAPAARALAAPGAPAPAQPPRPASRAGAYQEGTKHNLPPARSSSSGPVKPANTGVGTGAAQHDDSTAPQQHQHTALQSQLQDYTKLHQSKWQASAGHGRRPPSASTVSDSNAKQGGGGCKPRGQAVAGPAGVDPGQGHRKGSNGGQAQAVGGLPGDQRGQGGAPKPGGSQRLGGATGAGGAPELSGVGPGGGLRVEGGGSWTCRACTLVNEMNARVCEACGTVQA